MVIDDLATTGGSKFEAIEKLAAAGLKVQDVVVLIDRQSGAAEALAAAGHPPARRAHLDAAAGLLGARTGSVPADQIAAAREFLAQ